MSLPEAVVLFGASGFLGRNLIAVLRDHTWLIGVTTTGRPVSGCRATVTTAALDALGPLPQDTAIVHLAAFRYSATHFSRDQAAILDTNLSLTRRVYAFALARGIKEVRVASSSAVYPASSQLLDDTVPLDLNAPPYAGEAAYAWSKRWAEIEAELWRQQAGIHTVSLRLTNPYGPFDTLHETEAHVATAFVLRALGPSDPFEIRGNPAAERDFIYAGDVAAAFFATLRLRGVHTALNCASGQTTRIDALARLVMRAAGRERPLRPVSPPTGADPGVNIRRATATRLFAEVPGIAPFRPLEQGLRETTAWYRDALG